MTNYSQNDARWRNEKLGFSPVDTIGMYGCAVTGFAILTGKTPSEVNNILKNAKAFLADDLVIWKPAADALGLLYNADQSKVVKYPCFAAVRTASGAAHFVIMLSANQIIDPWDGVTKVNPYRIVDYRNITPKEAPAPVPAPATFLVRVDKSCGANVRTAPRSNAPQGGSMFLKKGDVFEATEVVAGESVNGINTWYHSKRGNYVWSFGLTRVS